MHRGTTAMSASLFWARFLELSADGPDLLRLVCNHLQREDRQSLRGVNRAMRLLLNATVTHISCNGATAPAHELLDVFPRVSSLDFLLESFELALAWLPKLSSSSEGMLEKLQQLTLEIRDIQPGMDGNLGGAVSQLLDRRIRLCSLTVVLFIGNNLLAVTFVGSGTGAQAQALNLRQQLDAFQHSPATFLAPSSWPHHACLTCFEHKTLLSWGPGLGTSLYSSHTVHALTTPSLQRLRVLGINSTLPATSLIQLTNLTHLAFFTDAPTARNPLLQSLSSLSRLQHLFLRVAPETAASDQGTDDERRTDVTLPPAWRQLSSLTAFHLGGPWTVAPAIKLRQLPFLTSLRDLSIALPCIGGLSDITHLTSLTSLSIQHPLEGAGAPDGPLAGAGPFDGPLHGVGLSDGPLQGAGTCDGAPPDPCDPGSDSSVGGSSVSVIIAGLRLAAGGTGVAVAAPYWSQLQRLVLHGPMPSLVAVLPQLSTLRDLCLRDVVITPDLCWALGALICLKSLTLASPSTAPPDGASPPLLPEAARWLLHCRKLTLSPTMSYQPRMEEFRWVTVLATCTRLRPDCQLEARGISMLRLVEVGAWSRSWLDAALAGMHLRPEYAEATFVLHDDAEVGILAEAAGPIAFVDDLSLDLCFGSGVSARGVQRLAPALAGKIQYLDVGDDTKVEGLVGGWEGALALTSEHLMALLPVVPTLKALTLYNCSLVEDDALIAVCKAGWLLDTLVVGWGGRLTDTSLLAIARWCRQLDTLHLCGCGVGVSMEGLLPLLTSEGELSGLIVSWAGEGRGLERDKQGWDRWLEANGMQGLWHVTVDPAEGAGCFKVRLYWR